MYVFVRTSQPATDRAGDKQQMLVKRFDNFKPAEQGDVRGALEKIMDLFPEYCIDGMMSPRALFDDICGKSLKSSYGISRVTRKCFTIDEMVKIYCTEPTKLLEEAIPLKNGTILSSETTTINMIINTKKEIQSIIRLDFSNRSHGINFGDRRKMLDFIEGLKSVKTSFNTAIAVTQAEFPHVSYRTVKARVDLIYNGNIRTVSLPTADEIIKHKLSSKYIKDLKFYTGLCDAVEKVVDDKAAESIIDGTTPITKYTKSPQMAIMLFIIFGKAVIRSNYWMSDLCTRPHVKKYVEWADGFESIISYNRFMYREDDVAKHRGFNLLTQWYYMSKCINLSDTAIMNLWQSVDDPPRFISTMRTHNIPSIIICRGNKDTGVSTYFTKLVGCTVEQMDNIRDYYEEFVRR